MSTTIMWFRKDLRLDDNTAFNEMLEQRTNEENCICIFQLNPQQFLENSFNHDAFFTSVQVFCQSAKAQGVPIHFLFGEPLENFSVLKKAYQDWGKVFFNKDERGFGKERDQQVADFFKQQQIQEFSFQDSHLHGAREIKKPTGESYKVFTPYYKKWLATTKRPYKKVQLIPPIFVKQTHPLFTKGEKLFNQLLSKIALPFTYDCGEKAAQAYLKHFIVNHLHNYQQTRDYPFADQTSKLSRFLRTGELSIRKVWQAIIAEPESDGRQVFISELCWRDFYNMIYFENPKQKTQEIKAQYRQLQWRYSEIHFDRWKKGETGYPIVDAAMRQLNQTGWMHNRLRMIVASFLTKDLLIDWRLGERYFQEKLIDYDSASNIGGWQWAASTGTDAVPYFRIFNPTTQSEKFDRQGDFIRLFIPELEKVPNAYIHSPEKMPKEMQENLGCFIGTSYPKPIVNHSNMRAKIFSFYQTK